ncbi:MAG: chorismate-binding protein [Myxococcota bacterium]
MRRRAETTLADAAAEACATAGREARRQWLAWTRTDTSEGDLFERLIGSPKARFGYAIPAAERAWAGRGQAASVMAQGTRRFETAQERMADVSARLWWGTDTGGGSSGSPLWVGGFAFDDAPSHGLWDAFPPACWWIPETLWTRTGELGHCTATVAVDPGDDPATTVERVEAAWAVASAPTPTACPSRAAEALHLETARAAAEHRALVEAALAAISRGELEKAVVARALDVEREAPIDVWKLTHELRHGHPASATFWVGLGDSDFVGATPERLLRREGSEIRAMALAGSAARGRDPEEDGRLRRALVESKKEQAEHAVAVRELRDALEDAGAEVDAPDSPGVLELGGVRHLHTPLRGHFESDASLFDVARRSHPTAAVSGAPRLASRAWLGEHEALERGWYAGLVGFTTPDGEGELSAALRCALVQDRRARLFAGGGIVAGSDPDAELRETRLKWNVVLPLLLDL